MRRTIAHDLGVQQGSPSDPRRLAFDVLTAVERGGFADAELGRRLVRANLDARDQALATRLVYGTLAWQGYLDHVLAGASQRGTIDLPVRIVLRLALFQLLKLTRVPDHAAVDTAVEMTKRIQAGAAGFVNAVLRRVVRERDRVPAPGGDTTSATLAREWSHPEWLVRLWCDELGIEETRALLAINNEAAPTVLRANQTRTSRAIALERLADAGCEARAGIYAPHAIVLDDGADPARLPGFSAGEITPQGEASQLVALMTGVQRGQVVWDACAAPGGKATYLAEQLRGSGRLIATDVNEHGIAQLRQAARRLGLRNLDALVADAAAGIGDVPEVVDAALVDAPCSGLGTLRQHPEIRWRRTAADLAAAAERQRVLLTSVAKRVKPAGVLVYATCTIAHVENDGVIADFLARHSDFTIVDPRPHLPVEARGLVDGGYRLRTWPHRDGLDGFYAVRMQRSDAAAARASIPPA